MLPALRATSRAVAPRVSTLLLSVPARAKSSRGANSALLFDPFFDDLFSSGFGLRRPQAWSNAMALPEMLTQGGVGRLAPTAMRCNLVEKPDHFEVTADVPGFAKEQIKVEVDEGVVSISAEKADTKSEEREEAGVKYHRQERVVGTLRRTIKLPASANLEDVSATSHNGVLTVTVPKKSPEAASGKKTVVVQ